MINNPWQQHLTLHNDLNQQIYFIFIKVLKQRLQSYVGGQS